MSRIRITRQALELKFKGTRAMERPRTRWFSQELNIMIRRKGWQEMGEGRERGEFSSINMTRK
jgi:hypothetical protein